MEGPPSENLRRVFLFTRSEEDGFPVAFYKAYCTEINIRQSCLSFHLLSIGFKKFFDMYFPIKAGHKMGARTKSLWAGTTSFPGLLRDYTCLPTSSSASQPSHPNWIDVHKDHFRLWTKASIWSMIRSRPVYARKGATSNMGPHCLRFYAPGPFLSFLDSLASLGSMLESQSVTQQLMFSRSWAYLGHI